MTYPTRPTAQLSLYMNKNHLYTSLQPREREMNRDIKPMLTKPIGSNYHNYQLVFNIVLLDSRSMQNYLGVVC